MIFIFAARLIFDALSPISMLSPLPMPLMPRADADAADAATLLIRAATITATYC